MEAPSDAPGPSAADNEGQYGTAPQTQSDMRYCLREIAKNPLRDYPSSMALYGMEPDGTLLDHPVFTTNFAAERDSARVFARGENDPATCALAASGAGRAPAESIEMCTWDAIRQKLKIIKPFSNTDDIFHVFKLPLRRVAVGSTKHMWPFGARLGPMASGHW